MFVTVAPAGHVSVRVPPLSRSEADRHMVSGGAGTAMKGLGTVTVARRTPMGSETDRETAFPARDTFHADEMSPLGDINSPATEAGPMEPSTRGARETSANAGAVGVKPTRCFHCHSPMPPQRKM